MRREERVTVQGPIKKQPPDGMSHRGSAEVGGGGKSLLPPPLWSETDEYKERRVGVSEAGEHGAAGPEAGEWPCFQALGPADGTSPCVWGGALPCRGAGGLKSLGGGGLAQGLWWLALLACGGAYWPLVFEPSAMPSRPPHYRTHPPAWGGGSRMQLLPMASSPEGLISAR